MSAIEAIKRIAAFSEPEGKSIGALWSSIHFKDGVVSASSPHCGAQSPIDLDLECSVNAAVLLKAIRSVGKNAEFSCTKTELILKSGRSKAKVPLLNSAAKFLPSTRGMKWKHVQLPVADRVGWACSQDFTRPHLTGVHLGPRGMEATNGLALSQIGGINFEELLGASVSVAPSALKGLSGDCWMAIKNGRLFIATSEDGTDYRTAALLDSKFPPTDQLIAGTRNNPAASVDRATMIDVLKRAKLSSSNSSTSQIVMSFSGDAITASTRESATTLFDFNDTIPIDYENKPFGCDLIGVDGVLLQTLLQHADLDRVLLRIGSETDPIIIESGEYLGVVMPMRI